MSVWGENENMDLASEKVLRREAWSAELVYSFGISLSQFDQFGICLFFCISKLCALISTPEKIC